MLRKARDRELHGFDESTPIPTQEYMKKAVENATPEFDRDFQANPWLCALQFLGIVDGMVPGRPLGSIKNWVNAGKVDKVVAVIKSCTPNGLGGLMVTLKDPTGTAGASIHHKVLSETEYGKDISLGSVLILQEVAVFAPSQAAYYLNITLGNLSKVFPKHIGPPAEQHYSANAVRSSTANIDHHGKADREETGSTMGRGTAKEILEDMRRCRDKRLTVQGDSRTDKESLLPRSSGWQDKASLPRGAAVEREVLISRQEAVEVLLMDTNAECNEGFMVEKTNLPKERNLQGRLTQDAAEVAFMDTDAECNEGFMAEKSSLSNKYNSQGSVLSGTDAINSSKGSARDNEIHRQTQALISKTSLPQWTDEQLQELFASDGEDIDTIF